MVGFGLGTRIFLDIFIWLERFVLNDFDVGRKHKLEYLSGKSDVRPYL